MSSADGGRWQAIAGYSRYGLALLLLAYLAGAPYALADNHCPRPAGVPPGARYSCPTHTQTYQPGEPKIRHPGGSPGRGTSTSNEAQQPPGTDGGQTSVHCQIENDGKCHCGPRKGTGRNIPCRPDQNGQAVDQTVYIFNYFYVNGINTPLDGPGRGNYRWDSRLIRANLLDLAPVIGINPRPRQPASLRVAPNERTVFQQNGEETYNLSGTQPLFIREGFCKDVQTHAAWNNVPLQYLCDLHEFRGGKLTGGLTPGDLLESFFQSSIVGGENFASTELDVLKWAGTIRSIYERERQNEKNFFILIGHSQGNFFVEAIALRLARMEGPKGAFVFRNRLGILSLASPTNYNTLSREGNFRAQRIKRFTRRDDGIQALHALGALGGKVPWPQAEEREALWPWTDTELAVNMALVIGVSSPLVNSLGKGPSTKCVPDTNPTCDHGLYTPFMNSHLLENYIADPPFTQLGKPIHPDVARMLLLRQPVSPQAGRALLTDIRTELMQLKQTLFQGSKNER